MISPQRLRPEHWILGCEGDQRGFYAFRRDAPWMLRTKPGTCQGLAFHGAALNPVLILIGIPLRIRVHVARCYAL